jgi:alkanesulfonate monooxygenase SsuD/methylene tetrahydromethanopterin reductase-like flavin-dependent oxidoreductase (luciferase family)
MDYDVFFSISQTPANGQLPSESTMFGNFFDQVEAADRLGYGTAWIAESHLSSEVQKTHSKPVIPHWEGEVGLNVDMLQLAHKVFARTERIQVGSAITNILCMGGPVAHAERVAYFLALHGLDPAEQRKVNVGFAAGRFDFMNRASGVVPRNAVEEAAGRVWKGKVFSEAAEIFCRLLAGETLSSDQISPQSLSRGDFRSDEDWARIQELAGTDGEHIALDPQWTFEPLKIIPQDFRRDLLQLVIGSHDGPTQEVVQSYAPCHVFNLSITRPEVIEDTHQRLAAAYHADGGAWERRNMPRTTFVFLNAEPGLTPEQQRERAHEEARVALATYWTALEGTLDPSKVERAADNALIGNPDDVAQQMLERFHPEDRLMLWFDFFNHDNKRVIANMEAFMTEVAPRVAEAASR